MAEAAPIQTPPLVEHYQFVDDDPILATARATVRANAQAIMNERRQAYERKEVLQPWSPIDALSTAFFVHQARDDNEVYHERLKGLQLDCQRLVSEWYRKKKPEYFEPIRHLFDHDSEEFFSHGLSVRQMTENALTPFMDNPEEEARRINERVEDATPQIVRKLGSFAIGGATTRIRTISECTDKAITDYKHDMAHGLKHRGYNGYVPEIEKVMVRDIWFDEESNDRFQEQIGLPGDYITHDVFQEALRRKGLEANDLDKTGLHGSQILAKDDLLDFVQLLDQVASEFWCVPVFMGEVVPAEMVKDYAGFREEAKQRQSHLEDVSLKVTTFVLDLAADREINALTAPLKVEQFVKKLLLDLGEKDLTAAKHMFGAQTIFALQNAAREEALGNYQVAQAYREEALQTAEGGGYCGAGSCGLESVNTTGEAGEKLLKELKAEAGDTIVRDTERACKCGKKSIVYAYNKNKVNKLCESCGAFESKVSKVV